MMMMMTFVTVKITFYYQRIQYYKYIIYSHLNLLYFSHHLGLLNDNEHYYL